MIDTPASMRAVVLDAPGPLDALQVRDLPIPTPQPGQVLIKVEAFEAPAELLSEVVAGATSSLTGRSEVPALEGAAWPTDRHWVYAIVPSLMLPPGWVKLLPWLE